MRCVTYAGETVTTTDDVAEALVQLTASIAAEGQAEAVSIPIVTARGRHEEAELVIGVGNDVLSAPASWEGEEPDFSWAAHELRQHKRFPQAPAIAVEPLDETTNPDAFWDPDLEGFTRA
ncbi:hypothetical protein QE430_000373 [Microbacterium testaceum]|uniref:Uncharacterized protein n=1 Tax=Microbacterium algihabitans TaxID=3075992 RepID=A0ABU3RU89_9MICO|nr:MULTISPECIES: hypothetical protein [Microbacterium]MDQ1172066.1 hypothetical protein [Microbacterium testaceum]MDU0326475.1 hypothetical protein [Microbacterium sp. KSW2-21]